jgi:hypothetical protein
MLCVFPLVITAFRCSSWLSFADFLRVIAVFRYSLRVFAVFCCSSARYHCHHCHRCSVSTAQCTRCSVSTAQCTHCSGQPLSVHAVLCQPLSVHAVLCQPLSVHTRTQAHKEQRTDPTTYTVTQSCSRAVTQTHTTNPTNQSALKKKCS